MSIQVRHLSKQFGSQWAVHDVSFNIGKGEIVGFLGPNGAGKSTTMKMITGFIPPTGGEIEVCGMSVDEHPLETRARIGYLPEHNPLYTDLYVREYLEFAAAVYSNNSLRSARITEVIEQTGLTPERHKKVGQLSKGYRQRLGIAQALLHNPEVLILDEPTSGLDPNQLTEIRQLIRKAGEDKTVIFSSHIMQEVQAVAQRVIIINKGRIVADAPVDALQQRLRSTETVLVQFKQQVDISLLRNIAGTVDVEQDGNRWRISSSRSDLRENVFQFATQHRLTILELTAEAYHLEDVFRQLTSDN